ncbi:hypothetical protein PR202_ga22735 [Eleusine coracana subsp. coracana]|uniref:NB-ARC domain-containing protein n=1 Tax=Eleusine coracana subsp. coracana TaxID=191504 RepID=A0AAV5D4E8_ELECO|nr:hypothetical protein PR202_ga22735 [Eleusine coracana subsp. coracana]
MQRRKKLSRPGVRAWPKELKTVSYEANDIFDEFKYETLRREAEKKGHHRTKVLTSFPAHNPIVFRYRMGKKLRKIVQTIEVLVTEMNTFDFRQQAPPSKQWRKTDSIMVDFDKGIVSRSRDEEKKKIIKILLGEASNMDLTVLPISGMGGLGKTTFVQLIYNDPAIKKHFELRRWCCVSDDFDAANIASTICQASVNDNRGREKALQDLQSLISGKRYLIVLDDVWNPDNDMSGKLRSCLKQGGKGSAVLTTTRNAEIARRMSMGAAQAHNIEKLSDEYVKEIIQSRAFDYEIDKESLIQLWMAQDFIPVQEDDHPEAVGEEIFKELTWRSFFEDVEAFPIMSQLRNGTICKIHDLMHDIAQSVMEKECVTILDMLSGFQDKYTLQDRFITCGTLICQEIGI